MAGRVKATERVDPVNGGSFVLATQRSDLSIPIYVVVKDAPKLDLDAYISNYEGRTRLERLRVIGICSRTLGVEALRKAVIEASTGKDGHILNELLSLYNDVAPPGQAPIVDDKLAVKMEMLSQRETERLENDLKGYKNNLIKESIRLGNYDLGQHYYQSGKYTDALRAFSSMREYCTVPKHAAEMALKLILNAVAQKAWMNVTGNVFKLQNLSLKPEDKSNVEPMLAPLNGLAHLESNAYKEAASDFLRADPSYGTVEAVGGVKPSTQILSPNDVATYGGLCALATLPRHELTRRVLENADFRSFLELESHLRRAIVYFCDSKYTQCLEILESYKADYLLDMHLQRHVDTLYAMIRRKSMVAYCGPFSRVSIAAMATAFSVDESQMELELLALIKSGDLDARLDLVDMLLVANSEDKRSASHARALKMADDYENMLRLRLFKINMLQHGFELKLPARKDQSEGMGANKSQGMGLRSGRT